MAGEVIAIQTNAPPAEGMSGFTIAVLVAIGIAIFLYFALRARKDNEADKDRYLAQTNMMRQLAIENADDHYFSSWWRPMKNAPVERLYEVTETKKIRQEPLIGRYSRYMGHYNDSNGKIVISVCTGKNFIIFPRVEVIESPEVLVHIQDDRIILNCVGVERKSLSAPYHPVVRRKDGKIMTYGFSLHEEFFEQRVATEVIEDQGNTIKRAVKNAINANPTVKGKQAIGGAERSSL